jgi:hypothetical protein
MLIAQDGKIALFSIISDETVLDVNISPKPLDQ